ncbi:hypothetical protein HNY73_019255 [Argiope bruennichi]|uniref:Uncharacterized protein n=1 Tax=Argiope bruennichi TaxID=94029 RepID=A0A8T0EGP6_ARGBR|nr:hypothetical protein HNY73_019255 [Argiope bruennichi]
MVVKPKKQLAPPRWTFKTEKKVLTLDLPALPKAKGNRTLPRTDFLGKAGIVLNLKHKNWHFYGDQTRKIPFREDIPNCHLREEEGEGLTKPQLSRLKKLLMEYQDTFNPGVEATPYIEHRIDTGNAPGDRVWVTTHLKSNKANQKSTKFTPRRDGPYIVTTQSSLTSYDVADPNNPKVPLGTYPFFSFAPMR